MGRKVSKNLTNRSKRLTKKRSTKRLTKKRSTKRLTKKRSTKRIKSNVNTYRKNLKNKTKRRKYTKRRNTKRRNTKRRNTKYQNKINIKGGAELMGLSVGVKAALAGVGLAAAVAIRRLNKKINKKIEECTDIKRELTTTRKELEELKEEGNETAVNQQKIQELEDQLSEMGGKLDEKNKELKALERFKGKLSTKSTDGKGVDDEKEMEGLLSEDGEDDEDEAVEADEAGEDDETDEAGEKDETGPDAGEDDADDVEEAKPCSEEDTVMLNQMTSPEAGDDLALAGHVTKPCLEYMESLESAKDDYIETHGPNFKMSELFKEVYRFDVTELKIAEKEAPGKVRRGAQAGYDIQRKGWGGPPSDTFPYRSGEIVEYFYPSGQWGDAEVLSDTFNTDGTIQLDVQSRAYPKNVLPKQTDTPQRTDTLIYNDHDWMEDIYPINIVGRTETGWLVEYVHDKDIPSWGAGGRQFVFSNEDLYIDGDERSHPDNFKWSDHYE